MDSITVRYALKWSNSAIIESSKTYVSTLDSLAFISEIKYVGTINPNNKREAVDFYKPTVKLKSSTMETSSLNELDYGKSYQQNQQIGVLHLHKKGFNGNRISVAVFDAGFKNITKMSADNNKNICIFYTVGLFNSVK